MSFETWKIGVNNDGNNGTDNNQYYISDTSSLIKRLTIQRGTGTVGIDTNTPISIIGANVKLDVNGSINLTENIYKNGQSYDNNPTIWIENETKTKIYYMFGNVGINNNEPMESLDVNGNIKSTNIIANGSGLTNLNASEIAIGNISTYRLPGTISVSTFIGSGVNLTNLNANNLNITSGKINNSVLPSTIEVLSLEGDGQGLNNLDASKFTSGNINNIRLPANISVSTLTGSGTGITNLQVNNISGKIQNDILPTNISVSSLSGNGLNITNLNASNINFGKITSSIFLPNNIKVQYLSGDGYAISNLDASKITQGKLNNNLFNNDISITGKLSVNNLSVSGESAIINSEIYKTENMEIINNNASEPSLIINHNSTYNNLLQINSRRSGIDMFASKIFTILKDGNVGIGGTLFPNSSYKLDVEGNINSSGTISSDIVLIRDSINFYKSSTQNILIKIPQTLLSTYTITLPNIGPSANNILKSDSSGNLSWVDWVNNNESLTLENLYTFFDNTVFEKTINITSNITLKNINSSKLLSAFNSSQFELSPNGENQIIRIKESLLTSVSNAGGNISITSINEPPSVSVNNLNIVDIQPYHEPIITVSLPKIKKIKLRGISGTWDANPYILEYNFKGLGIWADGNRSVSGTNNYINVSESGLSRSPYGTNNLQTWVNGGKIYNSSSDATYVGLNGPFTYDGTQYVLFDFQGSGVKPYITDIQGLRIYYDRTDISISGNRGTHQFIAIDENNIEYVLYTYTIYESNVITEVVEGQTHIYVDFNFTYGSTPNLTPQILNATNYQYHILTFEENQNLPSSTTDGNQRIYNINFPENVIADILIVGGGGAGGKFGGGGGAGAILFKKNAVLNGNINVKVGRGGYGSSSPNTNGENGKNSSITISGTEYISIGGGGGGVLKYQDGLKYKYYNQGYFNDNVNWFASYNPVSTGYVTDGTNIGTLSNNVRTTNSADYYSFEWTGYFKASVSGTYTFYTASDDASYCWVGPTAVSGFTISNALVNNQGLHGMQERSGTINLIENTYYPIRYQFGENGGADDMQISFTPPGSSRTYNGNGYFYSFLNNEEIQSSNGISGGSGGGGAKLGGVSNKYTYEGWESFGNTGGNGNNQTTENSFQASGGGGGAGSIGGNISSTSGGIGGSGKEFISYFGNNVGHNGWFAGGGGGQTYNGGNNPGYPNGGNGLFGGGGIGGYDGITDISAGDGLNGTGGGGGGSKLDGGTTEDLNGGNGGSGIVIIRTVIKYKYFALTYNQFPLYPLLTADSTNLVAWYKFDGNFNDSSGNGHHLIEYITESTPITSSYSMAGESVQFINNDDYLEFPSTINPYTIWNGNGITFSFWVRFTEHETWSRLIDFQETTSTDTGILVSIKGNFRAINSAIYVKVGNTYFEYSNWSDPLITTLGVWNHFVFSIDLNGYWNIYLNNIRINGTQNASILNKTSWGHRFINKSAYSADGKFDGFMDDFRIYNKVLSQIEISTLYNINLLNQTAYSVDFPVDTTCDILVVGGGGGGGAGLGGGGGAGGLIFQPNITLSGQYSILVGKEGLGATSYLVKGTNGANSKIYGTNLLLEAYGGGGSQGQSTAYNDGYTTTTTIDGGFTGGSGGGGTRYLTGGGDAIDNPPLNTNPNQGDQGYDGGTGGYNTQSYGGGGGGGGAGGRGGDILPGYGGAGGLGLNYSSTFGTSVGDSGWFASGGGGNGARDCIGGIATLGGGGYGTNGETNNVPAGKSLNALQSTGGGGGGGSSIGGNGGSGIVIVRYKLISSIKTNANIVPTGYLKFDNNLWNVEYNGVLTSKVLQNEICMSRYLSNNNYSMINIYEYSVINDVGVSSDWITISNKDIIYIAKSGYAGAYPTYQNNFVGNILKIRLKSCSLENVYKSFLIDHNSYIHNINCTIKNIYNGGILYNSQDININNATFFNSPELFTNGINLSTNSIPTNVKHLLELKLFVSFDASTNSTTTIKQQTDKFYLFYEEF